MFCFLHKALTGQLDNALHVDQRTRWMGPDEAMDVEQRTR